MSTETEAAGALIDASLVAHEIETTRLAGGADTHGACRNCGATLQGRFCHVCGQAAHIHRSLLHLGEELLHGLFHFDAKGWRTLPLLVARPGLLTRRFIDGPRARYVSPLALFLFMVFLMFFAASLTSAPPDLLGSSAKAPEARAELERELAKARTAVADAQRGVERAHARNAGVADAEEALADARDEVALSFMSLLFVALMSLGALHASTVIPWLASIAPPLHMAAQLRESYRLGVWGTVWRTMMLMLVSAIVFVLFLLLIVYVTMG